MAIAYLRVAELTPHTEERGRSLCAAISWSLITVLPKLDSTIYYFFTPSTGLLTISSVRRSSLALQTELSSYLSLLGND